ncbi:MAG: ABC transporter substrate-binding protein [Acidobacteriota bacterium]
MKSPGKSFFVKKLFLILYFILSTTAFTFQPQTLLDDMGVPFSLTVPPKRIISLSPNITEILFALGKEDRLVGVTRFCDYPEKAQEKEKIGGMVDPNIEKIISLKPDLILAFRGNPLSAIERLRALNCPVFVLDQGNTLESLFPMIEKIIQVTHAQEQGEELLQNLNNQFKEIKTALNGIEKKPRVFLSLHGGELWTCGQDSFLHDLITQAGGMNIAEKVKKPWFPLREEELLVSNPEIIVILASSGKIFSQAKKEFLENPVYKEITAVKEKEIYYLDENLSSRLSPRIITALRRLARIFHTKRFSST